MSENWPAKREQVGLPDQRRADADPTVRSRGEKGRPTPILGLEKDFDEEIAPQELGNVHVWPAPGAVSRSTTHGGFDNDEATMNSVIELIRGNAL